jgi:hypothetical protein
MKSRRSGCGNRVDAALRSARSPAFCPRGGTVSVKAPRRIVGKRQHNRNATQSRPAVPMRCRSALARPRFIRKTASTNCEGTSCRCGSGECRRPSTFLPRRGSNGSRGETADVMRATERHWLVVRDCLISDVSSIAWSKRVGRQWRMDRAAESPASPVRRWRHTAEKFAASASA